VNVISSLSFSKITLGFVVRFAIIILSASFPAAQALAAHRRPILLDHFLEQRQMFDQKNRLPLAAVLLAA
jgi:hypothetical protein